MEAKLESRVQWLEQYVINLQNQINQMKQNPTVTIGIAQDFNCCNCTTAQQCYQMNGGWICAGCNKPLHKLPSFTASGAGQTGT